MKRIPRSHPLHKFCVIVALTILSAACTCLAFDPNEWRNTQALEVPAKGLVRVKCSGGNFGCGAARTGRPARRRFYTEPGALSHRAIAAGAGINNAANGISQHY